MMQFRLRNSEVCATILISASLISRAASLPWWQQQVAFKLPEYYWVIPLGLLYSVEGVTYMGTILWWMINNELQREALEQSLPGSHWCIEIARFTSRNCSLLGDFCSPLHKSSLTQNFVLFLIK